MNLYFKQILLVSPEQDIETRVDLWVKDGKIEHCSAEPCANIDGAEVIDGKDLVAAPGFFDMHVHLREPGFEYKEDIASGTLSAANGGFTGVCCMPNTEPAIDNATVIEYIKAKSSGNLVDVLPAGAITQGREGKKISQMLEMADSGVRMFTDDGSTVMDSETLKRAFEYSSVKDILISQHCEDVSLTQKFTANEGVMSFKLGLKGYPSVAEEIILSRDLMLAEYCGNRRYHASHISTAGAVELIRNAKRKGMRVTAEATPHHFTLTDEALVSYDTSLKMNPPLRTRKDVEAIVAGLADGTIDCIATDHAPHALHEKDVEFDIAPNGIVGLETALAIASTQLVATKAITLRQMVEKLSVNPRKILKLESIKIEKGANANITVFAPNTEWVLDKAKLKSKSKNSPFHGFKFVGKPVFAINNGNAHKCEL